MPFNERNRTDMLPPKETIENMVECDFELLESLDEAGCFIAPEETFEDYRARIAANIDHYALLAGEIEEGANAMELFGEDFELDKGSPIPHEVMNEGTLDTKSLFGFSTDWVPGYFLSKGLGLLWGGCTIYNSEYSIPFFFIRKNFASSEKFFIYSRRELIAHELCHVARCTYPESEFEEHFAYMTSPSFLRRHIGNFFRSERDALFFIAPVFVLLGVQVFVTVMEKQSAVWPFWVLVLANFAFFYFRNLKTRIVYSMAEKNLASCGFSFPRAILFRSTGDEIYEIASLKNNEMLLEYLTAKTESELRWKVTLNRFGRGEDDKNGIVE